ncbi:hypothetical protein CCHR01_19982 [Colletotrichum chrysophilum]|uniref:Uncharacterized protein n=1 Tax=Colletotrichum chrysophilum TaxID=1836956 RepID=A0AAD8ZZK5_9PEZI|nr:hypothetical protein CCHR01_19982 [Colletotrichum chrysophilum]
MRDPEAKVWIIISRMRAALISKTIERPPHRSVGMTKAATSILGPASSGSKCLRSIPRRHPLPV